MVEKGVSLMLSDDEIEDMDIPYPCCDCLALALGGPWVEDGDGAICMNGHYLSSRHCCDFIEKEA